MLLHSGPALPAPATRRRAASRRRIAPAGPLRSAWIVPALAFVVSGPLAAQGEAPDTSALLYRGLPYGSQAHFSPLTVLLNRGYDMIQVRNADRHVLDYTYGNGFRNGVWDAVAHPVAAIERLGGWWEWTRTEILPISFSTEDSAWFVNYTDHLLMGGLTYRMLGEWYEACGAPWPRVWAALTTHAANVLNEAVEHLGESQGAASSVADLYVFDLASYALFSFDRPYRFFASTLQAAEWSNLAAMTFPARELQNNGQYWILKVPTPWERHRIFLRGGMGGEAGVSRRLADGYGLSVGLGLDTKVRTVDPVTGKEAIEVEVGTGLYLDRHNSLLVSAVVSPAANKYSVNVYPGVLPGFARELGLWAAYARDGDLAAGLVFRSALGAGVGLGW